MPTENELKFILDLQSEKKLPKISRAAFVINQAYIGQSGVRIRSKKFIIGKKKNPVYEFCFKMPCVNRLVELNIEMDKRDFEDLWQHSHTRLTKVRYEYVHKSGLWEIDCFKHDRTTYFVMAEHEMPENQKKPKSMPDFISDNLIFEVPYSDSRFASRRIAHVGYARDMLKNLIRGV